MLLTFLGTGDAAGVPVYGCTCPVCCRAKEERRFRRLPCSALLEIDGEQILIDAGRMDIADRFPVGSLSRIFLTHYHMDHVQGLFHLRWGCNTSIPVHGPGDVNGCGDLFKHPGILDFSQVMKPFEKQSFGEIHVTPVPLNHSKMTLGYCFSHQNSRLAYLCDTSTLPPATLSFLQDWQPNHIVLDCTHPPQESPPRNHNDYSMVLNLADKFKSSSFWLTHISHNLDLWLSEHLNSLPDNVQIARDTMEITIIKNSKN
ncbi:MAG: phosphonate metabolism protein PhnP [Thermodesulfobacteriota bacterium]|nr:phosphonate metabolism protein PhnP [Thermodesulfobacteriota bacterium]